MSTMQPTRREERRLDRITAAQIARDDEAASAKLRREEDQAARAERRAARKQRAARWDALTAWVRGHLTDLLFVPVIAVPAALAWSAMAAYGHYLFGPAGYMLPAASEGGMWVFEARATWIARSDPDRPVWQLETGAWVAAAIGAGLNFLHGITVITGHPHGVIVGTVMAIISASGLVAHQIVNLGPRRSRADRRRAKLERATERRAQAVRRAALSRAAASVDAHGNARVLFRPGTFMLVRKHGRAVLETVPSSPVWLPWPMVLPGTSEPGAALLLDVQAAEAVVAYRGWHSAVMAVPSRPVQELRRSVSPVLSPPRPVPAIQPPAARQSVSPPAAVLAPGGPAKPEVSQPAKLASGDPAKPRRASLPNGTPRIAAGKRQKVPSSPSARRAEAERLLRAQPGITNAELVRLSGVSERTVPRIRREMPRHLHVAEG